MPADFATAGSKGLTIAIFCLDGDIRGDGNNSTVQKEAIANSTTLSMVAQRLIFAWTVALIYPSLVFLVLLFALGSEAWRFCLLMISPILISMSIITFLRNRQYIASWTLTPTGVTFNYYHGLSLRVVCIGPECVSASIAQDPFSAFPGDYLLRVYDRPGHVLLRQYSDRKWNLRAMQNLVEALSRSANAGMIATPPLPKPLQGIQ